MSVTRRFRKSALQNNISNIRHTLRQRMEALARTHRGCDKARGCGCALDNALTVLERAERELFDIELTSYASPSGYDHYDQNKFDKNTTVEHQPEQGTEEAADD